MFECVSICESVFGGVVHVYASQILIILQTAVFSAIHTTCVVKL